MAFIANGSILPRHSGVSDLPLSGSAAVEFISPPELEVSLKTLHQGSIKGMGIPEGITIIIGGGFHGKSTLLSAVERGIYNHIPGDGRHNAVSIDSCVKIRAEEGRCLSFRSWPPRPGMGMGSSVRKTCHSGSHR